MENNIETAQIFLRTKSEGRFHDIQTIMGSFSELMVEYAKKFEIELPNEEEIEKAILSKTGDHEYPEIIREIFRNEDISNQYTAGFYRGVKFILNIIK